MKKLNQEQIDYLNIFRGLISSARQDELNRKFGQDKNKQIEQSLVDAGILKRDKRGSLRGPTWHDIGTLIRLNTLTLDQMIEERNKSQQQIKDTEEKIARLTKEDQNFCFYSREVYESLQYYKEQVQQWDKDINSFKKKSA